MPKPKKGPRLGSGPAHQRLMLNGIAAQLFVHEHINTTEAKAKAVRPLAEKLITFAKKGDVAARREVLKQIPDRDVVHKLFSEIGPRFAERNERCGADGIGFQTADQVSRIDKLSA